MTNINTTYQVIGCMSGTSLDGLDIACCQFQQGNEGWSFEIVHATTISYTETLHYALAHATTLDGQDLVALDHRLGKWMGTKIFEVIQKHGFEADFIASHGHTIFHQPNKGFTLQIGNIHDIHAQTGLPVVGDFRSMDVALGGQGAPLVPVGDQLLFSNYDYCLNLGGIANISFDKEGYRLAFDICPVNMAMNLLAAKEGKDYDKNGQLAKQGKVIPRVLDKLNAIPFYHQNGPKSLGKEYFDTYFLPVLDGYEPVNLLATMVEHVAIQISSALHGEGKILVTGGGAHNKFLIKKIEAALEVKNITLVMPTNAIVDFKEALLFGFLGVLHKEGIPNCLKSVTGASKDNIGGIFVGL